MATQEFIEFMAHYKVEAAECQIIAAQPFGLTTIDEFGLFFEAESSFKAQMFDKVRAWDAKGWMIAALKKAWLAAIEVNTKEKPRRAGSQR